MRSQKVKQIIAAAQASGNATLVKEANAFLAAQSAFTRMCRESGDAIIAGLVSGDEASRTTAREQAKGILAEQVAERAAIRREAQAKARAEKLAAKEAAKAEAAKQAAKKGPKISAKNRRPAAAPKVAETKPSKQLPVRSNARVRASIKRTA